MPKINCKPLPPIAAREIANFWKFVDVRGPDECWPWLGGTTNTGYGTWNSPANGKTLLATRVAYFLQFGEDPYPFNTLHTCDNPPCQNGAHLFKGTQHQNMLNMIAKGRGARGDKSGARRHPERYFKKLNPVAAETMRILYPLGWFTYEALGKMFGVTKSAVYYVLK
jgi:hypothetical protein